MGIDLESPSAQAELDALTETVGALPEATGLFVVNRAAALNITTGDIADWDTEEHDEDGWFNLATNAYIPLVAGWYEVKACLGYTATATGSRFCWLRLRKNGALHKTMVLAYGAASTTTMAAGSCLVHANGVDDDFDLRIDHNDTGARPAVVGAEFCWMTGRLVARD